jgi:hypothetical protein
LSARLSSRMKINGVPVRIYSAAKTVADCLKYRRKLGGNFAKKLLRESIDRRKCSEQRLRHFKNMPRTKIGSHGILFGRESMSFKELTDKSNIHRSRVGPMALPESADWRCDGSREQPQVALRVERFQGSPADFAMIDETLPEVSSGNRPAPSRKTEVP